MVAVTFAPILNPKRSTCLYLPLSVQIFKYVGGSNIAKLWFKKKGLVRKYEIAIEINRRIFYKKTRKRFSIQSNCFLTFL